MDNPKNIDPDKKRFLEEFDKFLASFNEDYGKCYFESVTGQKYQGWISEINENAILFYMSGPLASDETVTVELASIALNTLGYWDAEIKEWTDYFEPDKLVNRDKTPK